MQKGWLDADNRSFCYRARRCERGIILVELQVALIGAVRVMDEVLL
jgi:hypothetical protein